MYARQDLEAGVGSRADKRGGGGSQVVVRHPELSTCRGRPERQREPESTGLQGRGTRRCEPGRHVQWELELWT